MDSTMLDKQPGGRVYADMLTVPAVAEILHVHRQTVYAYIRLGVLDAVKLGDATSAPLRITEASLDAFLRDHVVTPPEAA
jgi:excisionase family DNA binding protein